MAFQTKTISQAKDHEPTSRGLGAALREVKQMVPGESKLAVIGEAQQPEQPIIVSLTQQEAKEKEAIVKILLKFVEPPMLSRKRPNPVADGLSFREKVAAMSLAELRRFISYNLDPTSIELEKVSEEFKTEVQKKYKDLSP